MKNLKNSKKVEEGNDICGLLLVFPKFIAQEKSAISKMVLQENYISLSIMGLIFMVNGIDFYKKQLLNKKLLASIDFNSMTLPVPNIKKNVTLGQLIHLLKNRPLISKKYPKLIQHLESFNITRVDITHKILMKYKKISELERDSERVTKIGNLIIRDLNKSVHELADDFKRLSIETFKYVKEK